MSHEERDGYVPSAVEEKWQRLWEERGTNTYTREELENAEDPFYNLMMFPYPSAEGLHVGNIYAFTGADVHGRYQRLRGKTVFEPIGFDAFGIHSENFALRIGTHPMDLIPSNVRNFTRQLRRIGGMFDWDHVVDTTDPAYYKWTQWLFLQLFDAGLAERKEAPVNWCPSCMTVLANEQVIGGECERCGTPVEQRRIAQWFFKITKYAQRLLDNIETLDWSETTKKAQSNWIGRSTGAQLHFPVVDEDGNETGTRIEVYTTRPDTVFGATYMVLSPEHPLVEEVTDGRTPRARVRLHRHWQRARISSRVRRPTRRRRVCPRVGTVATRPPGELIPIWIADYVLMEYGTGAIMAVPGHDTRDFDFATAVRASRSVRVVAGPGRRRGHSTRRGVRRSRARLVNSGALRRHRRVRVCRGGDGVGGRGQGWGEAKVNFRLHDWCISQTAVLGTADPDHPLRCVRIRCGVPEEQLPVVLPRVEDFRPDDSGVSPLARVEEWYRVECPEVRGRGEVGRPTFPTPSSIRAGTSSAIRRPTSTTGRSTKRSRRRGSR